MPSDADIIMAGVKLKRREQTAVVPAPSTYAEDVATITSTGILILEISLAHIQYPAEIFVITYRHLKCRAV